MNNKDELIKLLDNLTEGSNIESFEIKRDIKRIKVYDKCNEYYEYKPSTKYRLIIHLRND